MRLLRRRFANILASPSASDSSSRSDSAAAKLWDQLSDEKNLRGGNAKTAAARYVNLSGGNATKVVGDVVLISGGNATLVIAFKSVDLGGGDVTELHCLRKTQVELGGGDEPETKYHTEEDLVKFAAETLGLTL